MDVQGPLSAPYVDAIKQFEGFAPEAAPDYKQWSNGYGTRARYPGERIDRDEAERRLSTELGNAGGIVSSNFPDLPEGHHAALTSLTYNAGPGWINSGLGNAVRNGDWDTAKNLFQQYNHAGGQALPALARRRAEEASWFDGAPGALSYTDAGSPMSAALRQSGNTAMADDQPPSLGAQFLTGGPGALFGKPEEGYSWGRALNNAAAWAQSLDTKGASLAAIKNTEDYSLVPGPDGSVYKIHKPTGKVSLVAGPQGKIVDVGVDQGGNPIKGFQLGNRLLPISALAGAAGAGAGSGSPLGQDQWLAKGVTEIDPNKQGEEYLAQYAPDVQAYVRALQEGRLPAAANARKGLAAVGTKAAAKYGEDMGIPMDATTLAERRKFATELGATSNPAMFGGQRTAVQTGVNHLKDVLDVVDQLGNSNGIIGSEYIASLLNRPLGSKFNSTDRATLLTELLSKGTAYGGERTKLLAGRAGGQDERQQIANELFGGSKSDEALRGTVRSELGIMMGRAVPLDQKLEGSTLLAGTKERNRVIGPEQQKVIDDIMRRTGKDYAPPAPTRTLSGQPPAAFTMPDGWSVREK